MPWYKSKLRAFFIHLTLSLLVAGLAALLVFGLWYPYPYRELSGGRELFLLLATVDVVIGPLITFVVYNPAKSRREKRLDFSVIGVLQLAALVYGLWTVFQSRPVHTVFEYDRFRVVHAAELPAPAPPGAPAAINPRPLTGPTWLSLRPLTAREQFDLTLAALGGIPLSAQPQLWQTYETGRADVLQAGHPATELRRRHPERGAEIDRALAASGVTADDALYLPLVGRKDVVWTVLLDRRDARVLATLPIDSF